MAPRQTTLLRQAVLEALDPRLAAWGFSRKKSSFEWFRRRPDAFHGIHLNIAAYEPVGRIHVIPSLEAGVESIERALVEAGQRKEPGISFGQQLTALLRCEYVASVQEGPEPIVARLAADLEQHGLASLERLSSLENLAELLASPTPRDWPVMLPAQRATLLPLALALTGRVPEALDWFARLHRELAAQNNLPPRIDEFGAWLHRRFAA